VSAVFLLLILCACPDERQSSFEQECKVVQKTWSGMAELVRTGQVKQNGSSMESSWDFEFAGNTETARKAFESNKPKGYGSTAQTDSELAFARFDGHDSFHLTVRFAPFDSPDKKSTTVSVVLKSFPD
jgi:hypothetical protein